MSKKTCTIIKYTMDFNKCRQWLKNKASKKVIIKRGDKRVKEPYVCNICGKQLVKYNNTKHCYVVACGYYKLIMDKKEMYYMCYNSKVCRKQLIQKQGTDKCFISKVV